MYLIRFISISIWASVLLLSCSTLAKDKNHIYVVASEEVECPGPDEAFVTTCSGSSGDDDLLQSVDTTETEESFDESDLVNEVLEDSTNEKNNDDNDDNDNDTQSTKQPQSKCASNDNEQQQYRNPRNEREDDGKTQSNDDEFDSPAAIQQLKQTTTNLIQRYYDPLPKQGKCAIGTICGFTASRLSLGVANRIFRIAGATWLMSEVAHTTGYCDEAQCVPEEARPWIGIINRTLRQQFIKVRLLAHKIWNQDRIREIVKRDEVVAAAFAAGAFVGFIV